MRKSVRESMGSSFNHKYQTPDYVLDIVCAVGTIALDPCTNKHNPVRALEFCTPTYHADQFVEYRAPRRGGLALDWTERMRYYSQNLGHVVNFINPPYGLKLKQDFGPKIALEGAKVQSWSQIALVPARVDTEWFAQLVASMRDGRGCVCLWNSPLLGRRITFRGAKDPAFFPSALLYWGNARDRFEQAFRPHGLLIRSEHIQLPALSKRAQRATHAACA